MTIKNVYQQGSGISANYNYTDVADGSGVVAFYLADARQGSGVVKSILVTNKVYSWSKTQPAGSYSYDTLPFNLPRTIRGTALASIGMWNVSGGEQVIVQVQKVSGGVVTNCSAAISGDSQSGSGIGGMNLIYLPLTETYFLRGDILRLAVSSSCNGEIGNDPMGRDGSYIKTANGVTTTSTLFIPFKIDLQSLGT